MSKFVGVVLLLVGGGSLAFAGSVGCTSQIGGYDPYGCASAYQNVVSTFNYFQPTTVSPSTTVSLNTSVPTISSTSSTDPTVSTGVTQTSTSGATGLNMYGVGMNYNYAGGVPSAPLTTQSGNLGGVSNAFAPTTSLVSTGLVTTSVSTTQNTSTSSVQYGYGAYSYVDYGSMLGFGTSNSTGMSFNMGAISTANHISTTTTTTTASFSNVFAPAQPTDPAPEPGSVILIGSAAAALFWEWRRRRA